MSDQTNFNIPYKFYGETRKAILCRDDEVILAGPADTGKTFAWLWKLHTLALRYPGCQLAIIRKVKEDLYGSVLHTFKRDFLEPYAPYVNIYGGEKPQFYDYPNGSRIWTGGMDKPGATLSSERDVILVCQAEQLSLTDHEFLTRCVSGRGAKMPYTQLVEDCNPAHPTSWIIARSKEGKLTRFNSSHKDNPELYNQETGEIMPAGKRRLRTLSNLTGVRRKRLFLGLWAAPEGAIYEVFDETKHKCQAFPIPAAWGKFAGVDPVGAYVGALWIAFDPVGQMFHVYREYCEPFGIPTKKHVENIIKANDGDFISWWACGGPSERQQRTDYQSHGLPVCTPGISDVWSGIDRVIEALDSQLVIHDSCPTLLDEIGSYRRKIGKDGQPLENTIVDKDAYHMLDCLRYALVGPEGAPVDRVIYRPVRIR
jgi:hypothetical protein